MANTLFDKIWDKHVVQYVEDGHLMTVKPVDVRGRRAATTVHRQALLS